MNPQLLPPACLESLESLSSTQLNSRLLVLQNAVIGTVAVPGTGFQQDVYNLTIRACGRAGGCNVLPLLVYVRDAIVYTPSRIHICYLGLVCYVL